MDLNALLKENALSYDQEMIEVSLSKLLADRLHCTDIGMSKIRPEGVCACLKRIFTRIFPLDAARFLQAVACYGFDMPVLLLTGDVFILYWLKQRTESCQAH